MNKSSATIATSAPVRLITQAVPTGVFADSKTAIDVMRSVLQDDGFKRNASGAERAALDGDFIGAIESTDSALTTARDHILPALGIPGTPRRINSNQPA